MDQHLDCARVALSDEAAKIGFKVGLTALSLISPANANHQQSRCCAERHVRSGMARRRVVPGSLRSGRAVKAPSVDNIPNETTIRNFTLTTAPKRPTG